MTNGFKPRAVGLATIGAAAIAGSVGYGLTSGSKPEAPVGGETVLAKSLKPVVDGKLPADVKTSNPIGNRTDYDLFSWASFLALNWPPDSNGEPDFNKTIGENGDNQTVWEGWMEDSQFLVKAGDTPPVWRGPRTIPAACLSIGATGISSVLTHATKTEAVVGSFNQAQAGPLIDLNRRYVRYEITVNQPMYDYMVDNNLYDSQVLENFGTISFPEGDLNTGAIGAIMTKGAWKIMGHGDDPSRFHVTRAYIYNATNDTCSTQDVGLVGLHISTKTKSAPQWIWSTFEHVDNVPLASEKNPTGSYNFFNPQCQATASADDCKPNLLPATPWDPARSGQIPVQATRVDPIDQQTEAMNEAFQAALKEINPKSVWANYMLVGTQYPQKPTDPTDDTGRPFPPFLANVTMETFLQGQIPPTASNCIGCHSRATTSKSPKDTDFAYILSRVPLEN